MFDKRLNKYKAQISIRNKARYIGHFATEEEANHAKLIVQRWLRRRLMINIATMKELHAN